MNWRHHVVTVSNCMKDCVKKKKKAIHLNPLYSCFLQSMPAHVSSTPAVTQEQRVDGSKQCLLELIEQQMGQKDMESSEVQLVCDLIHCQT